MTFWTQVGAGVYIVGAVAFSLYIISVDGFPKVTLNGPPMTPKQERSVRFGIAVGMYSMLIITSLVWPIFVVVKVYNQFARDDDDEKKGDDQSP